VEEAIPVLVRINIVQGSNAHILQLLFLSIRPRPAAGHKLEVNRVLGLLTIEKNY